MNITTPPFPQTLMQRMQERFLRDNMEREYTQGTLQEMVAAKKRIVSDTLDILNDRVRKTLAREYLKYVVAYEREAFQASQNAVKNINDLCAKECETIYAAEVKQLEQAQEWFNAGLLSQTDYERMLNGIERWANNAVFFAETCADELVEHYKNTWRTTSGWRGETVTKQTRH